MAERPPPSPDPDATVAMPAASEPSANDPDLTVSMPSPTPRAHAQAAPVPGAAERRFANESSPVGESARVEVFDPEKTDPFQPVPFLESADPDATVRMASDAVAPSDETIAIPTPGRRANPFAPKAGREAVQADLAELGGMNPLLAAANPILAAVPQIRQTLRHPRPERLLETLAEQIETFEANAGVARLDARTIEVARDALCALLDESASRTPWGRHWIERGLVAALLGGDTRGAKFFDDLERALERPIENADLLEFFYVCLALGYEGKYRDAEGGREALEQVRIRLHAFVRTNLPVPGDGELSERWRGIETRRREIPSALALWGAASGTALALLALYLGFAFSLGEQSDRPARELARLAAAIPAPAEPVPKPAPAVPLARVVPLLEEPIRLGQIAVTEDGERSIIVVRSDRLFASGSARLDSRFEPIVLRIAEALERVPGPILVTGHTDDVPIRTARFHSNWELSAARAETVLRLMAQRISDPRRLRAEGLADSEPVAPNDSEANRARNRRVVVILQAPTPEER